MVSVLHATVGGTSSQCLVPHEKFLSPLSLVNRYNQGIYSGSLEKAFKIMWWLAQVQTPPVTIPSFTIPTIVVSLLIAILIGAAAQLLVGYTHMGFLGHILVGIIGAFLGSAIAAWLRLPNILV